MSRIFRNLFILVLIGLAAALPVLMQRVQNEERNNSAEILFDYAALCDYARASGQDADAVLRWCRAGGVTAVAVEEQSRDSLALRGIARLADYFQMSDLQAQGSVDSSIKLDPVCAYYVAKDNVSARNICRGASCSLGKERARILPDSKGVVVELRCDIRTVASLGVGIPMDIVRMLHDRYGFKVWIRPWNSPDMTEECLASLVGTYGRLCDEGKIEGLIFGGIRNEVYGFPNDLDFVASLINNTRLKLGVIELAPKAQQDGVVTLAKKCLDHVVRVMAVSPAHQAKLDPETVVSMYSLGVRERNIRLAYCRPYSDGVGRMAVGETNQVFMGFLQKELGPSFKGSAGTFTKDASTDGKQGMTWWSLEMMLISAAIAACFCLLIGRLRRWNKGFSLVVLLVALLTAFCCVTGIGCRIERLLLALASIIVFPVFAYVFTSPMWERAEKEDKGLWPAVRDGIIVLAVSSGLALCGGLLSAALLSDIRYMLSLEVFRGVKLHSMLVPAMIFAIWLVRQHQRGGLSGLVKFFDADLKVWHVAVFAVFAVLGAFYVVRTGNSGGDAVVSETERALRRWLDLVLGVRPRFKEFLLGNPALVLLPMLARLRWKCCVPLAVLASAVGLASLSDTYAHIHTPLLISLHRTLNGVVIGGCLGILLSVCAYVLKAMLLPYTSRIDMNSEGNYWDESGDLADNVSPENGK